MRGRTASHGIGWRLVEEAVMLAMSWTGEQLRGRRVTVMGLGRFGGGIGAVNYLLHWGAHVTLTDVLSADQLTESLQQIDVSRLTALQLGGHREQDFVETDLVVVNPAVPPENRWIKLARQAHVPLSSEMNLFWMANRGRVIAVTGTVGKSTTAALIAHMLRHSGLAQSCTIRLGGNIGVSLLEVVADIEPHDWTVLELSSFQLHMLGLLRPQADIAVVTNFYPNHLDWHGTLEHYQQAKRQLLNDLTPQQAVVRLADSSVSAVSTWPTRARCWEVSLGADDVQLQPTWLNDSALGTGIELDAATHSVQLPGNHNRQNIGLALGVCAGELGLSVADCVRSLATYQALPHRLEYLREVAGRVCYNDSKATTPEAALEALKSFSSPIRLIAGGADKGVDLSPFAEQIGHRAASVSVIGAVAPELARLLMATSLNQVNVSADLRAALATQWTLSQPGDVILLSPGCASFGEFRNYEERGELFRSLVAALDPPSTAARCRATS